jgi:hypothetical protein
VHQVKIDMLCIKVRAWINATKLSFEQFIRGDSQGNVQKILEIKLKIGGRPEGTKVALFRKLPSQKAFALVLFYSARSNHN